MRAHGTEEGEGAAAGHDGGGEADEKGVGDEEDVMVLGES